jgi:hypothetical protein
VPSYLTGRQRTLQFSGEIIGKATREYTCGEVGEIKLVSGSQVHYQIAFENGLDTSSQRPIIDFTAIYGDPQAYYCDDPNAHAYLTVELTAACGLNNADQKVLHQEPGVPGKLTYDCGGSWSMSMDVEEVVEISDTGTFPSYGGTSAADPPYNSSVKFSWRLRVGGVISVSASSGSLSAGKSVSITQPTELTGLQLSQFVECRSWATTGSIAVTSFHAGESLGFPFSESGYGVQADAGAGARVSTTSPDVFTQVLGSLGAYVSPPREFRLNGKIAGPDGGYPEQVALQVEGIPGGGGELQAPGGLFDTGVVAQRSYNAVANFNNQGTASVDVAEFAPVRVWLIPGTEVDPDPHTLRGLGEDPTNWRVLFRGKRYRSFDIQQDASYDIDDGDDLTPAEPRPGSWEDVENTTLSVVSDMDGTRIRIVVGVDAGTVKRTFDPGARFSGYRWARFKVRCTSIGSFEEPMRLKIGEKEWEWVTGDEHEWVERVIDLCCPHNATALKDGKETKWPLPTEDSDYWGVTDVAELFLEGLAAGLTYEIQKIELIRGEEADKPEAYSQLTILPAFNSWSDDGNGGQVRVRFLDGITDGRRSLEESEFYNENTFKSITELLEYVNEEDRNPGWSATANPALPGTDGADYTDWEFNYLNNNRPGVWVGGGGLLYQDGWQPFVRRDASAALGVDAQMLFDQIDWHPGCGDVFGLTKGEYGGPIQLRAGKILRGQARGLVLQGDNEPAVEAYVRVKETEGDEPAGSGYSDEIGVYYTGSPYGKGTVEHTVETLEQEIEKTFSAAKAHNATFRGEPALRLLGVDPLLFPFTPQFSDPQVLAPEEWRRIAPAEGAVEWRAAEWRNLSGPSQVTTGHERIVGADDRAQAAATRRSPDANEKGSTPRED